MTSSNPSPKALQLFLLPSMQQYGLGDQLLEFLLQLATLNPAIERVAAVTLCKAYPQQSGTPMEEYIHQHNSHGLPVDPILAFHVAHGAQIRPPDDANLGKGVLVDYLLTAGLTERWAAASSQSINTRSPAKSSPVPVESVKLEKSVCLSQWSPKKIVQARNRSRQNCAGWRRC